MQFSAAEPVLFIKRNFLWSTVHLIIFTDLHNTVLLLYWVSCFDKHAQTISLLLCNFQLRFNRSWKCKIMIQIFPKIYFRAVTFQSRPPAPSIWTLYISSIKVRWECLSICRLLFAFYIFALHWLPSMKCKTNHSFVKWQHKFPKRCNDGSAGGYYYREARTEEDNDKWIFYLEGGGMLKRY